MKRIILPPVTFIFLFILLAALGFCLYCVVPMSYGKQVDVFVVIPYGSSLDNTSLILQKEGLIHGRLRFQILARVMGVEHCIKSGEYHFTHPMTPVQLLDKITRGKVVTHSVTIPEGSTIFEIAQIVEEAGLCSGRELLKKAVDRPFIISLGIRGESLEGYLFPETYKFSRGVNPEVILKRMVVSFNEIFTKKMATRAAEMGLSKREVVTLASMVEKETTQPFERPIIAKVFLNRLRRGMRLECDPTVIYGLKREDPSFHGRLRKRHLRKPTPYNTYKNSGLPPGPICNPGLQSIMAVLYPADVDYLYFVSKNDGTHKFSKSLKEHNVAVARYQKRH